MTPSVQEKYVKNKLEEFKKRDEEEKKPDSSKIIQLLWSIIFLIVGLALIYYYFLYPPRQTALKCRQFVNNLKEEPFNQGKDVNFFYDKCISDPSRWLPTDPSIKY